MIQPLAVSMGDPAGIGPEIIVKAAARLKPQLESGKLKLLIIGSNSALEQARAQFTPELAVPEVTETDASWPALAALQAGREGQPIRVKAYTNCDEVELLLNGESLGTKRVDPIEMAEWIRHPQQMKPGTAMPDLGVGEREARDIAAFLSTLRAGE